MKRPLLLCLACTILLSGCGFGSWHRGGVRGGKPYTVHGKTYYPLKSAHGFIEEGVASWYGPGFHGRLTASGERFNQNGMTAAHKILPLGTRVRVTNLGNGRQIYVLINDRGPFVDDRVIDLSRRAATEIGMIGRGTARVRVQSIDTIRRRAPDGGIKGTFYVQVGAFANKHNADRLVLQLMRAGEEARSVFGENNLWNVQAGPWPDSAAAQRQLARFNVLYPHSFVIGGE